MERLSRRLVLKGLYALPAAVAVPVGSQAAPSPELEDIYGRERLQTLWRRYQAGKPIPDHMQAAWMFDAHGRFRASKGLREGFVLFLIDPRPVEIELREDPIGELQPSIDLAIVEVFQRAGRLPPDADFDVELANGKPILLRYWTREDWRQMGWPTPFGWRDIMRRGSARRSRLAPV